MVNRFISNLPCHCLLSALVCDGSDTSCCGDVRASCGAAATIGRLSAMPGSSSRTERVDVIGQLCTGDTRCDGYCIVEESITSAFEGGIELRAASRCAARVWTMSALTLEKSHAVWMAARSRQSVERATSELCQQRNALDLSRWFAVKTATANKGESARAELAETQPQRLGVFRGSGPGCENGEFCITELDELQRPTVWFACFCTSPGCAVAACIFNVQDSVWVANWDGPVSRRSGFTRTRWQGDGSAPPVCPTGECVSDEVRGEEGIVLGYELCGRDALEVGAPGDEDAQCRPDKACTRPEDGGGDEGCHGCDCTVVGCSTLEVCSSGEVARCLLLATESGAGNCFQAFVRGEACRGERYECRLLGQQAGLQRRPDCQSFVMSGGVVLKVSVAMNCDIVLKKMIRNLTCRS